MLAFWIHLLFFSAFAISEKVKIAFIGDTGVDKPFRKVLKLIKSFGADAVVHQGDFDYVDNPILFDSVISSVLGDSFPYYASIGNHDVNAWQGIKGYQNLFIERLKRAQLYDSCHGDFGTQSHCSFKGLTIALMGIGSVNVTGNDQAAYVEKSFSERRSRWNVCSFHKNQRLMQPGSSKKENTGYEIYESCKNNGAMVITGHHHSYARSKAMNSFEYQDIFSDSASTIAIHPTVSLTVVNGVGGKSISKIDLDQSTKPWWAKIIGKLEGILPGALLCTFNIPDALPQPGDNQAMCQYTDIANNIWDEFVLISNAGSVDYGMD